MKKDKKQMYLENARKSSSENTSLTSLVGRVAEKVTIPHPLRERLTTAPGSMSPNSFQTKMRA